MIHYYFFCRRGVVASHGSHGSSSQGSTAATRWDNPFNRAMNLAKKIESVMKKSSSAGRLAGLGGKNWVDHFGPPPRTHVVPSGRSEEENREVQELKAQVARIPQIVQDNLAITLSSFLPTLVESIAN